MQKTWGPFTGRQLTTIVCILGAALLLPGAAYAVDSFTNVAIEDPVSGAKASVDSTHHVVVGDGSGPLTVDGAVTDHEAAYNTLKHWWGASAGNCATVAAVSTSRALVIKTARVNVYQPGSSTGNGYYVGLRYGPVSNPCETFVEDFNPTGAGPMPVDFGAGLALPAGDYLSVLTGGGFGAEVSAYGFTVPASQAPPAAAAAKAASPQQK
jgi:hypothetical protein